MDKKSATTFLKDIFLGPATSFGLYWKSYGGFAGLFQSLYCYVALFLAGITTFVAPDWDWTIATQSILSNILGFTLGGYAIVVGFGDKVFLDVIRGGDDKSPSPYMAVNGTFVHFILLQVCALLVALLVSIFGGKAYWPISLAGNFLFFYALLSVVAVTLAVLNLASWYDEMPPDDR